MHNEFIFRMRAERGKAACLVHALSTSEFVGTLNTGGKIHTRGTFWLESPDRLGEARTSTADQNKTVTARPLLGVQPLLKTLMTQSGLYCRESSKELVCPNAPSVALPSEAVTHP